MPTEKKPKSHIVIFKNVRLSYPALFKPRAFDEKAKPKYQATALMNKTEHADLIAKVKATMQAVAEEKWGVGKVPKTVKYCLHDGNEKPDTEGYGPDVMYVGIASDRKIPVVDRAGIPLLEESGKPYAGCYVNISANLWAQDNAYGRRVNAGLRAIQFVADGDSFGAAPVDPSQEFDPIEEVDPMS